MNGAIVNRLSNSRSIFHLSKLLRNVGADRTTYNTFESVNRFSSCSFTNYKNRILFSDASEQQIVDFELISAVSRHLSTTGNSKNQAELKRKSNDRNDSEKKSPKIEKTIRHQPPTEEVSTNNDDSGENVVTETRPVEEKLTMTQRFKKMYKEYWYVLLPVHVVTSSLWLGGFYYLSTSGVDIPALLETMHFSETAVDKIRDSSMGHFAITYMLYKIATPLRYPVTLAVQR